MKASVAVVLVFIVAAVSGCVGFGAPLEDARPPPPGFQWVSLSLPDPNPHLPVFQFWVPQAATELRIIIADVEIPTGDDWTPDKSGHAPVGDLFSDSEPRVHVLGPDAKPLTFTTYGPPVADRPTPPGFNGTIITHTHEARDPAPGAYLVVLYGYAAPPAIEIRVPTATPVAPMLSAPFAFQRVFLHEGGLAADGLTAAGDITLPPRTLIAYGDLIGTGVRANLELSTAAGTVARTGVSTLASPPGWRGLTLGLDWPSSLTRYDELDPEPLVGPTLSYQLDGTGTAQAFALLGTASMTPPPYAAAVTGQTPTASAERVELSGEVPDAQARWFLAPQGATLEVKAESSSDPSHFRVYDLEGRRVQWGETADGVAFAVPAGPLIVVNDGPGPITLALLGAAPTDATLHEVNTTLVEETQDLDALQGHDAHTKRIHLDAPALQWQVETMSYVTDVQSTLLRDGTAIASAPDLNGVTPGQTPCCWLPAFTFMDGDAHWLDGGTYNLRTDASSGQGTVRHFFVVLDLADTATAAEQQAAAEPQD